MNDQGRGLTIRRRRRRKSRSFLQFSMSSIVSWFPTSIAFPKSLKKEKEKKKKRRRRNDTNVRPYISLVICLEAILNLFLLSLSVYFFIYLFIYEMSGGGMKRIRGKERLVQFVLFAPSPPWSNQTKERETDKERQIERNSSSPCLYSLFLSS